MSFLSNGFIFNAKHLAYGRCLSLILFLMLINCVESSENAIDFENTSWKYKIENRTKPNAFHELELYFDEDGYGYEKNTILFYRWKYYSRKKILALDKREFQLDTINKDTIKMHSVAHDIKAELIRVN